MEIPQRQASLIAHTVYELRPKDWRIDQVTQLVFEHRAEHPFPELMEAAVRAARNPALRSPTAIFLPGRHWDHDEPATTIPQGDPCADHPTYTAHNCSCCIADVKVGDRPANRIGKHHVPEDPTVGDPGA